MQTGTWQHVRYDRLRTWPSCSSCGHNPVGTGYSRPPHLPPLLRLQSSLEEVAPACKNCRPCPVSRSQMCQFTYYRACVGILSTYDVNQHVQWPLPLLNEFRGVMLLPLLLVVSKVSSKCLLAPLAVDRVCNGSKGRYRLVLAGVFKELEPKPYNVSPKFSKYIANFFPPCVFQESGTNQSQRSMPTHTVSRDANARRI